MVIKSLSDCLDIVIDRRGVTPKKLGSDWTNSGYMVLSANNIKTTGLINMDSVRYVDEKTYKKWMKDEIKKGDIILTSEAPAGEVFYWDSDEKIVCGQRIYGLRTKNNIYPLFLKYYLQSATGQNEIRNKCTGSTVFGISVKTFDQIKIRLPESLGIQKRIGDFLYLIDKKIFINNELNNKLESLAKTIYDYWFLQFEFPNEEGKPYKSSGGKMVWNEELKREIPEGWTVKSLDDKLEKNNEKFTFESIAPTIDLSVMPTNSISLNLLNSSEKFTTNLYKMKRGQLLFGSIRPYLLKGGIAPCDGAVTGTVHSFDVKNYFDYNFIMMTMFSPSMFEFAIHKSKGTKMPVISSDDLCSYKFAYNEKIARLFNTVDYTNLINHNIMENQMLVELRDFLLPLLMNGQVTFKEEK